MRWLSREAKNEHRCYGRVPFTQCRSGKIVIIAERRWRCRETGGLVKSIKAAVNGTKYVHSVNPPRAISQKQKRLVRARLWWKKTDAWQLENAVKADSTPKPPSRKSIWTQQHFREHSRKRRRSPADIPAGNIFVCNHETNIVPSQ